MVVVDDVLVGDVEEDGCKTRGVGDVGSELVTVVGLVEDAAVVVVVGDTKEVVLVKEVGWETNVAIGGGGFVTIVVMGAVIEDTVVDVVGGGTGFSIIGSAARVVKSESPF